MNQEETINDILEIVTFMKDNMVTQTEFKELKVDVAEIKTDVGVLKTDVADLKVGLKKVENDVSGLKVDVAELKTDVSGLKVDVAELKTDVAGLKVEIKQVKKEMIEHVDGFIGLDRKNQSEIASLAMQQDRQGNQIKTIAKHLNLDLA